MNKVSLYLVNAVLPHSTTTYTEDMVISKIKIYPCCIYWEYGTPLPILITVTHQCLTYYLVTKFARIQGVQNSANSEKSI